MERRNIETSVSKNPELLSVHNLRVDRGNTRILSGITWRICEGEHWVILGANGSGKTSLLAAIMAYLTPSHGEIRLLGRNYGSDNWPELRKNIGIVSNALTRKIPPDEMALHTVLSGESAQLGYWNRKRSTHETKAKRCLSQMGVGRLASRLWGVLSQGERQKVFIARALMTNPRILILDEPCAGLDPVAREYFLQSMRQLAAKKTGPSLVLVTHHVEEIIPEITHVLALHQGRTLAAGAVSDVLTTPVLSAAFGAPIEVSGCRTAGWKMNAFSKK